VTLYDKRLTAARADLAASDLKGRIDAAAYADGTAMVGSAGKTWIRRRPAADAPVETELLFGETFTVYEIKDGFAWGQAALDAYVGYVVAADLAAPGLLPTHRVNAASTFVYAAPDLKSPVLATLPLNALATPGHGEYAELATGGYAFAGHLTPLAERAPDFVAVAERFQGVPYLWGGRTPLGCDCSGLVQAALAIAGIAAPRDTDMQEAALGRPLADGEDLQRGDLVFWKGHVGILQDADTLLHANAHRMLTASEPLAPAIARIAARGSAVTSIRRL
jgi:cell wall-associated NlpC family hydrolase